MSLPPSSLLADIYRQLPFLVVHLTTDGIVLHCNPETTRLTGFEESELLGKNFWGLLFPGKLFAQVPRVISLVNPLAATGTSNSQSKSGAGSPLLKDVPMTLRTKQGLERVVGFTRHVHIEAAQDAQDSARKTFIFVGVDLTDRLLDAEREELGGDSSGILPFGPHVGNAGSIDSEIITPIAITPKLPRGASVISGGNISLGGGAEAPPPGYCSIESVREGLARLETHMACVQGEFSAGEMHSLAAFKTLVRTRRSGEPRFMHALSFVAREDWLTLSVNNRTLGAFRARVDELLALAKPDVH